MKYNENKIYDVVIVGSGLAGLVAAVVFGMEGKKVCLLEKNKQFGGNLQTFARDKTIFDTGVHYIGGLEPGQNLYQYFSYLGIVNQLKLLPLDKDGYDVISFDKDEVFYEYANGKERFVATLTKCFPNEKKAIEAYTNKMDNVCKSFPMYFIQREINYKNIEDHLNNSVKSYLDSITTNEKLKAVLAGTGMLYALDSNVTPFYVHALSVNSYMNSAFRCENGGSQITKLLISKIKEYGGEFYKKSKVISSVVEEGYIKSVQIDNQVSIKGKQFIFNIDPKIVLDIVGKNQFRKSFVRRLEKLTPVCSVFSVYIVLKSNSLKYQAKNHYHFKDPESAWNAMDYNDDSWPRGFMVSMSPNSKNPEWAESVILMTYMKFEDMKPWEQSENTTLREDSRGDEYEKFKIKKSEKLLKESEKVISDLNSHVSTYYSSTPLSYRDYIGNVGGAAYGYKKNIDYPLSSFIFPKTKVKNMFLTGQYLNMHGILGVTISAINTCSEIFGKSYLIEKIINANKN